MALARGTCSPPHWLLDSRHDGVPNQQNMMRNINFESVAHLLNGYKMGRYLEDPDLDSQSSFRLFTDRVRQSLELQSSESQPAQVIVIQNSAGDPGGLLVFKISDWDTAHFRVKTVILETMIVSEADEDLRRKIGDRLMELFLAWCFEWKVRFVVSKMPSLDLTSIGCLEKAGFRFVESWIYNKFDLRRPSQDLTPPLTLRSAEKSDLECMISYSHNAFKTHRFHADDHIPKSQAESLYEQWIRTSFNDSNQKILAYDFEGVPCAYMIYYVQDLTAYFNLKFAMWKMALMNPKMTGKGIGKKFFPSLCNYHRAEGLDVVDSGLSLRNIASMNTHNRTNFKVVSTLVTLHLWV